VPTVHLAHPEWLDPSDNDIRNGQKAFLIISIGLLKPLDNSCPLPILSCCLPQGLYPQPQIPCEVQVESIWSLDNFFFGGSPANFLYRNHLESIWSLVGLHVTPSGQHGLHLRTQALLINQPDITLLLYNIKKSATLGSVRYPFVGTKMRTRTNLMAFGQFRWYITDSHNRSDKAWYTPSTHCLCVFAPCLLCYNLSHVHFQAINELFYQFSSWQLWGVVILFPVQSSVATLFSRLILVLLIDSAIIIEILRSWALRIDRK